MKLWKQYWANENEKRKSLSHTMSVAGEQQIGKMFPNPMRVFEILLVIPATNAIVERSDSALRGCSIITSRIGGGWVSVFFWDIA